jgi:hypothetical protein
MYYLNVSFKSNRVEFSDLLSSVKYKMRLRALNEHTHSKCVDKELFTELKTPKILGNYDLTDKTMDLHWTKVEKAYYYIVNITAEEGKDRGKVLGRANTQGEKMHFEALEPNFVYMLSLEAKNSKVSSRQSKVKRITKLSPTRNLRSPPDSIKSNAFDLQWDKVVGADKYEQDVVPLPLRPVRQTTNTWVQFRGLKDGTKYMVRSNARNARTTGVVTEIQQYTRQLTPRLLKGQQGSVTSSEFKIVWGSVKGADSYQIVLGNDTHNRAEIFNVPSVCQYKLITGLLSGHKYVVTLNANNTEHNTFSDSVTISLYTSKCSAVVITCVQNF